MHERTLAELELRRAQLTEQAARMRDENAGRPALAAGATARARRVKALTERANDYAWILASVQDRPNMQSRQATES